MMNRSCDRVSISEEAGKVIRWNGDTVIHGTDSFLLVVAFRTRPLPSFLPDFRKRARHREFETNSPFLSLCGSLPPLPPLPPLDASGLITPNHIFLHSDRVFDTVIEISDIEILKTRSEENFGRSSEIDNNASWSSCVTRSNETRSAFYVTLFIDERSSFKWPIVDSRCVDNKFSIKILYFSGYFCMR